MELRTHRLLLRELLLTDLQNIHELHSLPEIDRFNTSGIPGTIDITLQTITEWLGAQTQVARNRFVFVVENLEKRFIGLMGINMGKPSYRNAEIWFKLHPGFWNQGYATEMIKTILHFCFTDLKLHRVEAGCAVENLASKRVLEKVGMTMEGRCRQILPIRGQWVDNFEFAILETDFATIH